MGKGVGGLLLALLLAAQSARAERCPVMEGASSALAAVDAGERIAYLEDALARAAHQTRVWQWSWTVFGAAIAASQLVYLAVGREDYRGDRYVGLGASAIGFVTLWSLPFSTIGDTARLAAAPVTDDRCVRLSQAEYYLLRGALNESRPLRWWSHLSTIAFGVGLGLAVALGFQHYAPGALTGIGAMTIGELRLNTQPLVAVDSLQQYRAGKLVRPASRFQWSLAPLLVPAPSSPQYGVAFGGAF